MQRITIFAMQGNTRVNTEGQLSATLVEGSFPGCTVSVFTTGTTNLATIFGDNLFPPTPKSNPFTATATGDGFFYAANGTRVDIQLSGTGIVTPFVLAGDVLVNDLSLTTISAPVTIPFAATPAFDLSQADWFKITLTGNVTAPTFPNPVAGSVLIMTIIQDATGGRTFAWPGSFLRPPAIAGGANAVTELTFKFDGTNWRSFAATGDNLQVPSNAVITGTLSVKGGSPWFDVTTFGAKCDAVTDDTAAIQAAWNAAKAVGSGTFVFFPPQPLDCIVAGTLNFSGTNGVRMGGFGAGIGSLTFPRLVFTGSAGPLVNCQNSLSITFQNIGFLYTNATFVGNVFDCTPSASSANIFWDNVSIGGTATAKTAANLILAPTCQKCGAYKSWFNYAVNGINSLAGNVFTVEDCDFASFGPISGAYLLNMTAGSRITGNNFEFINAPNTSTAFDSSTAGCFGCSYTGNWHGDMPAGWAGTVIKGATGGMAFSGNTFQGVATGTMLTINGGQGSFTFIGNDVQGPWGTLFTSNGAVSQALITSNHYSGAITNFYTGAGNVPISGIITDNNGNTTVYGLEGINAPTFPLLRFTATGGAADQKIWEWLATSTQLIGRTRDDALSNNANFLIVDRGSGFTVSDLNVAVPLDFTEQAAPAGRTGFTRHYADSGDHMFKFNPNNSGVQHIPQVYRLTAQYTNSTTGFTTVGTPSIAFPVNASENYTATCHLFYQAAATGGLNIQFTGPSAPTAVTYGLDDPSSATAFNSAVATAFSTSLGQAAATNGVNFDAIVSFSLINGANAGTVTLQAKSSAAAQLQIQTGSYCIVQ